MTPTTSKQGIISYDVAPLSAASTHVSQRFMQRWTHSALAVTVYISDGAIRDYVQSVWILKYAQIHWRRQLWGTGARAPPGLPASYFGDHSLYRL